MLLWEKPVQVTRLSNSNHMAMQVIGIKGNLVNHCNCQVICGLVRMFYISLERSGKPRSSKYFESWSNNL